MKKIPLFDLGNVIVKVDFKPFLDWLENRSKIRGKAESLLSSSLFFDFEFGNISAEEFGSRLMKLYDADFSLSELMENFCGIFPGLVEGMEDLLNEWQGDVYCLSNTNEIHLKYCLERFSILRKFNKIFASHEIHRRKPYPGIYRDVANNLGLAPSQLVFFDDVHANVSGALRAGLDAHLFESASQVRRVMKSFEELVDRSNKGELA